MKIYCHEVCEIGRESVKSVNATILATLIKELVNKYEKNRGSIQQHRKYYVTCKEKLEFTHKKSKKIGDDEGFESDANEEDSLSGDLSNEDAQSMNSCCLVEDHAFKNGREEVINKKSYEKDSTSLTSIIVGIDSANSSGSSDTDDLDMHSLTPSPISQSTKHVKSTLDYVLDDVHDKWRGKRMKEVYPIANVIFCHTEPKYPTVIAWVIKKHQPDEDSGSRLGITGVENFSRTENCLEVVVVKCKNEGTLKDLCRNYQEYSKRIKLDHYKTIKKKRDEKHLSTSLLPSFYYSDIKVSLSDMKIANSSLIKASELSILNPKIITSFKNDLKNSVSLNSLIRPEHVNQNVRSSQDLKATQNSPFHAPVKKTQSLTNLSKTWDIKCDTLPQNAQLSLSKEKNPKPTDKFNLIHRTDLDGVTHLEVSKTSVNKSTEGTISNKSKTRKEIEGIILVDVESYAKKDQIRHRQTSEKLESPEKVCGSPPPVRPERKKCLRKKPDAHALSDSQPVTKIASSQQVSKSAPSFFLSATSNSTPTDDQKVLRGPYVRVQSWGRQKSGDSNLNVSRARLKETHASKYEESYADRRRSRSAGRPPKKTPMAYRYVDVAGVYCDYPPLKCEAPQNSRDIGGQMENANHIGRRRKSFDDFLAIDNLKGNLKSVIKKNKKINDRCCEPKKVTFSAFATVQVVD